MKGLTAGLPPTTALWNLKLALAYYSSSLGNLSADIASRSSSGSLPASDNPCFGHVNCICKRTKMSPKNRTAKTIILACDADISVKYLLP